MDLGKLKRNYECEIIFFSFFTLALCEISRIDPREAPNDKHHHNAIHTAIHCLLLLNDLPPFSEHPLRVPDLFYLNNPMPWLLFTHPNPCSYIPSPTIPFISNFFPKFYALLPPSSQKFFFVSHFLNSILSQCLGDALFSYSPSFTQFLCFHYYTYRNVSNAFNVPDTLLYKSFPWKLPSPPFPPNGRSSFRAHLSEKFNGQRIRKKQSPISLLEEKRQGSLKDDVAAIENFLFDYEEQEEISTPQRRLSDFIESTSERVETPSLPKSVHYFNILQVVVPRYLTRQLYLSTLAGECENAATNVVTDVEYDSANRQGIANFRLIFANPGWYTVCGMGTPLVELLGIREQGTEQYYIDGRARTSFPLGRRLTVDSEEVYPMELYDFYSGDTVYIIPYGECQLQKSVMTFNISGEFQVEYLHAKEFLLGNYTVCSHQNLQYVLDGEIPDSQFIVFDTNSNSEAHLQPPNGYYMLAYMISLVLILIALVTCCCAIPNLWKRVRNRSRNQSHNEKDNLYNHTSLQCHDTSPTNDSHLKIHHIIMIGESGFNFEYHEEREGKARQIT